MLDLQSIELKNEYRYKTGGMNSIAKKYENAQATKTSGDLPLGKKMVALQYTLTKATLKAWIEDTLKPKKGVKPQYNNLLSTIIEQHSIDDFVSIASIVILNTLLNVLITQHSWLSSIAKDIATDLELELNSKQAYDQLPKGKQAIVDSHIKQRSRKDYRMNYLRYYCQNQGIFVQMKSWDSTLAHELCAVMLYIVISSSDWFEIADIKGGTLVQISDKLAEAWKNNVDNQIIMGRKFCPMVVKPSNWTDLYTGGYIGVLQKHTMLLRLNDLSSPYTKQYIKRLSQANISNTLKALNAIQSTPWHINTTVLEALEHVIKCGGGRAGIPLMNTDDVKPKLLTNTPSAEELETYKKHMRAFIRREKQRQSHILRLLSNLALAKDFSKYDNIYFPHNMDFRGRIYPIPSFNPQGDDMTKGLLAFSNAPCLTHNEQLKWLYVTGANLAGVDKVSYDDRIKWVADNRSAILACAEHPLDVDWWQQQDEPFQFLAFCLQYKSATDYLASHNNNISGWVCSLPIAFDGTCSGLQHFSAILRDSVGGQAVNLIDADKPQDIYGVVAHKVNCILKVDAQTGTLDEETAGKFEETYLKLGTRTMAQAWLSYGVTRKVTKRNVMTLAYGSKQYGFRQQLLEDIIQPDIDENEDMSIFKSNASQYATYLAKLIWEAVGTTVVKAVEGMDWLQNVSKLVTKDSSVVMWTTPCGLPVQQHYMKYDIKDIQLRVLNKRIRIYNKQDTGNIDKHKQTTGIAPNFIHSMDSSHLQLTVLACHEQGIKHFAVIHDSYACPLAQAGDLYRIVREEFIKMYTEHDVLAEFRDNLQHFSNTVLPQPPLKGDLEIKSVQNSHYFVC